MRRIVWLLVAACAAAGGCGGPQQADPAAARQALTKALDTWKAGGTPESLATATPPITAVDPSWKKGVKLLDYQVADQTSAAGYDLHFTVTLTVEDEKGKKKQQRVGYDVATAPKLVVVRADDN